MALTSPDSRCRVSDLAKHAFSLKESDEEAAEDVTGAVTGDSAGDVLTVVDGDLLADEDGDVAGDELAVMVVTLEYDWHAYEFGDVQSSKVGA